jgi:uncharacterized zinc-type alcohol dehydrogenase-like protein
MGTTAALSVPTPGAPLEKRSIGLRDLRADDVLIDIAYCGICHTDLHLARQDWGETPFPLVPGHEITGVVAAAGPSAGLEVGDRVGVGCMVDSCGVCGYCRAGLQHCCAKGFTQTYGAIGYDGELTNGGYARQIVVKAGFVFRIPDGLALDVAAPLLCAGITTYSPLRRFHAGPGKKVAVVGLGGLGHLGVKIAAALGAEVTVLSRTLAKHDDALRLGAHDHFATGDESTFDRLAGRFDLVLNTVAADLPLDPYLAMLRAGATMVNVGVASKPVSFAAFSLIAGNKTLAGSSFGSVAETQEMLEFCAVQGIGAEIETVAADQVDPAFERVRTGDVRYRFVIDTTTL